MHVRMMYVERLYWNVADVSVAAPGEDDDGRRCSRWAVAAADRVELVMLRLAAIDEIYPDESSRVAESKSMQCGVD